MACKDIPCNCTYLSGVIIMSDNDSPLAAVFFGAFLGIAFIMLIQCFASDSPFKLYKEAIAECEKILPRNQHCVVVGVPVDKN